jgi:hypothetical protein
MPVRIERSRGSPARLGVDRAVHEHDHDHATTPRPRLASAARRMEQDRTEPTVQLIREALEQARELTRLEVALAREEVSADLRQARTSAIAFGGAGGALFASFTMLLVAVALSSSVAWVAALVIAALLMFIGGGLALAAYKALPAKPMAKTRERIETDWKQLKERSA